MSRHEKRYRSEEMAPWNSEFWCSRTFSLQKKQIFIILEIYISTLVFSKQLTNEPCTIAQLSSLCADLDLSCTNVCAGVPALVGVGHSYQSWLCRQLEHLETQTFVVALGDRKNNRKQRNEALTSFVSPLLPQKDNLSISLIHPQASSHTFCLK